jgi:predicted PurR-regulated permease PerM
MRSSRARISCEVVNLMQTRQSNGMTHLRIAGRALRDWGRAIVIDGLLVGALWFIGLELIRVPLAPLWAVLGGLLQIIPTYGMMIALVGPVLAVALSGHDAWRLGLVLGLYALIAILDGLVIGPYVLHRNTKVPWWAALFGPILLGIVIPFWGVLLAPPLMAVIFAFKNSPARR